MARFSPFLRRAGIGCGCLTLIVGVVGPILYQQRYSLPPEKPRLLSEPTPNGYMTAANVTRSLIMERDGIVVAPQPRDKAQVLKGRLALVAANAPVLSGLHVAFTQQWLVPRMPSVSLADNSPELDRFRDVSRLLAFAAQAEADAGSPSEAAHDATDAIALGVKLARGGGLATGLMGLACEANGEAALWRMLPGLDATTARETIQRLTQLETQRIPLADILQEEKHTNSVIIREAFTGGPQELWHEFEWDGYTDARNKLKLFWDGPATVLADLDAWHARVAADAQKPWSAEILAVPEKNNILFQLMAPSLLNLKFKWAHVQAYRSLLLTALAQQAYRKEHGHGADTLEVLVRSGYLPRVPVDPFSPTRAPLRYAKGKVWSVGPDAKDDNGKPIESRYGYVLVNQSGDIVAGVNTWSQRGKKT